MTPICTKSFVVWGFTPDTTGGAYSAPPDLQAVFREPTSKGKRDEERGRGEKWDRRGGETRGGEREFDLCPGKKKKKSRRLWLYIIITLLLTLTLTSTRNV